MPRLVAALLLLSSCLTEIARADSGPAPGLYYDRGRDSHGLDLQRIGARLSGAFFSYAADGQPVWYLIDGAWSGETGTLTLLAYDHDPQRTPTVRERARFEGSRLQRVSAAAACGDGRERPGAAVLYETNLNRPDIPGG